jgi:hypothetical protein
MIPMPRSLISSICMKLYMYLRQKSVRRTSSLVNEKTPMVSLRTYTKTGNLFVGG